MAGGIRGQRAAQDNFFGESLFVLRLHVVMEGIEVVLQRASAAHGDERVHLIAKTPAFFATGTDRGVQVVQTLPVAVAHAAAMMTAARRTRA